MAKLGLLEATTSHLQLGVGSDPMEPSGLGVTEGKFSQKEIEMLFPEEEGMWARLSKTTDGQHRHYHQEVPGTERPCCQVPDNRVPGDSTLPRTLTNQFPVQKEGPGQKVIPGPPNEARRS